MISVAIVAIGLALIGLTSGDGEREPLPAYQLQSNVHGALGNEDLLGRPHVLFLSASYCSSCVPTIGIFDEVVPADQLVIVSIAPGDGTDEVEQWHANVNDRLGHDVDRPFYRGVQLGQDLGVIGVPMILWVDAEGHVASSYLGELQDREDIRERLDAAGEPGAASLDLRHTLALLGPVALGAVVALSVLLSPCAIPLIPAWLSVQGVGQSGGAASRQTSGKPRRPAATSIDCCEEPAGTSATSESRTSVQGVRPVAFAVGLAALAGVVLVIGSATSVLGDTVSRVITIVALAGAAIVGISLVFGRDRWISRLVVPLATRAEAPRGSFATGVAYGVAGLGCSAPLLLVMLSLVAAGSWLVAVGFIPVLLGGAAWLAATIERSSAAWLGAASRFGARRVQRLVGVGVLIVVVLMATSTGVLT